MPFQTASLSVNWCDEAEIPASGSPKLNFFDMSLGKSVLLIGNGPSAIGASLIEDKFDIVIRFNKFADYPNIGDRTDIWACCLNEDVIEHVCVNALRIAPKVVVLVQHDRSNEVLNSGSERLRKVGLSVSTVTRDDYEALRKQIEGNPTTGAIVAWHYIRNGYIPALIGFDQIRGRYNKYWSRESITKFHSPERESAWLTNMALKGKIVDLNAQVTSETKTIVGAWHIAMMNNWVPLVMEQESRLIASGLLAKTDKVIVGVVGDDSIEKWNMSPELASKATIVSGRIEHFEHTTLEALHKEAMSSAEPFKAWYIHTKGVSGHGNKDAIRDWRLVMEYFVIDRFEDCIRVLDSCDACGVNRRTSPPHFSGNFWWANSSHLKKLPLIRPNDERVINERIKLMGAEKKRRYAELWVGLNNARLVGLHSCKVYYESRYPESKYRK
jgi:hypothetical protein